jgi:hypothetical protein
MRRFGQLHGRKRFQADGLPEVWVVRHCTPAARDGTRADQGLRRYEGHDMQNELVYTERESEYVQTICLMCFLFLRGRKLRSLSKHSMSMSRSSSRTGPSNITIEPSTAGLSSGPLQPLEERCLNEAVSLSWHEYLPIHSKRRRFASRCLARVCIGIFGRGRGECTGLIGDSELDKWPWTLENNSVRLLLCIEPLCTSLPQRYGVLVRPGVTIGLSHKLTRATRSLIF